jgi:hypothetical protein
MAEDDSSTKPYREIPLTHGKVALVDAEDYDRIAAHKWTAFKNSVSWYAARSTAIKGGKTRRTILMHREIMNAPDGIEVDHRNHNTLDNRKSELRLATHKQNIWNSRPGRRNTSGFKGVSYIKSNLTSPWLAQIQYNGRKIYLGFFKTAEEANVAYIKTAVRLHGEYVCGGVSTLVAANEAPDIPVKCVRCDCSLDRRGRLCERCVEQVRVTSKSCILGCRLTEEEWRSVSILAKAAGVMPSRFLRNVVIEKVRELAV